MLRCEKEALSKDEMVLLSLDIQIFVVAIERLCEYKQRVAPSCHISGELIGGSIDNRLVV